MAKHEWDLSTRQCKACGVGVDMVEDRFVSDTCMPPPCHDTKGDSDGDDGA